MNFLTKPTIANKLRWGAAGVIALVATLSGIGGYAVSTLRNGAFDATRVGGRLNAVSLEIQVHNLEAQRRVKNYLEAVPKLGPEKAREEFLDEAQFEIHEIETLAAKAVTLAPTAEKRAKFEKIAVSVKTFEQSLDAVVAANSPASVEAYEAAAEQLHENAEDGEVAGRESSQKSLQDITRIGDRSMAFQWGISIFGLLCAMVAGKLFSMAILGPVEHLKEVAENVSLGNLDIEVRRFSNDELGDLADSFSRMVTAVKFFRFEVEELQEEAGLKAGGKA